MSGMVFYHRTLRTFGIISLDRLILHDPRVYSDPMEFRPERFLACGSKHPETDPHTIAFGFGRR